MRVNCNMARGKFRETFKRVAPAVLAVTTALSVAGYGRQTLKLKGAQKQVRSLREELREEHGRRMVEGIPAAMDELGFGENAKRRVTLDNLRSFLVARVPQHEYEVGLHVNALQKHSRLSPRDVHMLEVGQTLGSLDVLDVSLAGLDSNAARRVEDLRSRLRTQLERRGYR